MSYRIEEKYFIDNYQILDFKKFLFSRSAKKIFDSRVIKSLYFDNKKNEMYKDSIEGIVPRKKIRIRNYPNEKNIKFYLETKISSVEGRYKKRQEIDEKNFHKLNEIGILDGQYGQCLPKVYVIYNREYFKIESDRFTIDTNIQYQLYSDNVVRNESSSIVELKTSNFKNIDRLSENFPFHKTRYSKYCNAIDKCFYKSI
tara:strand:- start:56 stop:655 length:600 start_codon:yes stop_codon:yes gene_type:complete